MNRARSYAVAVILISSLIQGFSFNLLTNRGGERGSTFTTRRFTTAMESNRQKDVLATSSPLLISWRDKLSAEHSKAEGKKASLVLASQSPRRREILDMMGLAGLYTCEPPPLDESKVQKELLKQDLHPTVYTQKLAEAKAHSLATKYTAIEREIDIPIYYLGSDTVVDIYDRILEKPKSENEAKAMLHKLSGEEHQVHTGVAVYRLSPEGEISLLFSFTESAHVTFCNLGDADIDAYVASGEPMDKAGSYGIQGIGGQMVQNITGDFFTVMGLPMHQTSKHLAMALMNE